MTLSDIIVDYALRQFEEHVAQDDYEDRARVAVLARKFAMHDIDAVFASLRRRAGGAIAVKMYEDYGLIERGEA